MSTLLNHSLSLLAALLLLVLTLGTAQAGSPASGMDQSASPMQRGSDSADEDEGDDGGDEDEGEDEEEADDSEDSEDEMDADDEEGTEAEMSEESEESSEAMESEESAEYSEEYEYFESSEAFVAEEYSTEWSASVEWTEASSSTWHYSFSAPQGGSQPKPADLGLDTSGDIEYPFIWQNDGDELLFDVLILAAVDNGGPIDAATFGDIAAEEDAALHAEFPTDLVAPEHHMLGSHKWVYNAYGGGEDGAEVDVFSTFDGSQYYSLYFFGPSPGAQAQLAWDQMAMIVSSFDLQ